MDTARFLEAYYGDYDEDGRLQTRHGAVEFLTTMRYIDRYLTPGARVLEIGAGTGRYSHALARRGYRVDAVELVAHNIDIFKQNTRAGERITVRQGDARALTAFADNVYDITLLLGPMYHMFSEDDQKRTLGEALRVTKPGGVCFAAYCMSDPSVLHYGFIGGHVKEVLEKGMLDPETFCTRSAPVDIFNLYRIEDIDGLMRGMPAERLHIVAADGYANHMREALADMEEDVYQLYLKYHFATCERRDLLGYSHHTLDIFRKRAGCA